MGRINRLLVILAFGLLMGTLFPNLGAVEYAVFTILFMLVLNPLVRGLKLDKYINSNMFTDEKS